MPLLNRFVVDSIDRALMAVELCVRTWRFVFN